MVGQATFLISVEVVEEGVVVKEADIASFDLFQFEFQNSLHLNLLDFLLDFGFR